MYAWCEGVREGLRTYRTSHCFVAVCVPTLHTPSTLYMCSTSSPGFIELNKQLWMNSEPPRPHVLPLRRTHPDVKKYVDWKRVSYLRTLQHEKISRCGWGVNDVVWMGCQRHVKGGFRTKIRQARFGRAEGGFNVTPI